MTVKELIELLIKCDPKAVVSREDSEYGDVWVKRVEEDKGQVCIE